VATAPHGQALQAAAVSTLEMVHAQFDLLSKFHAVLDGRVPRPVIHLQSPLAMVMTEIGGRHIDWYASKSNVLTSKILLDASRAFVMTMQHYWSGDRRPATWKCAMSDKEDPRSSTQGHGKAVTLPIH
jgi:hypothetical protein